MNALDFREYEGFIHYIFVTNGCIFYSTNDAYFTMLYLIHKNQLLKLGHRTEHWIVNNCIWGNSENSDGQCNFWCDWWDRGAHVIVTIGHSPSYFWSWTILFVPFSVYILVYINGISSVCNVKYQMDKETFPCMLNGRSLLLFVVFHWALLLSICLLTFALFNWFLAVVCVQYY